MSKITTLTHQVEEFRREEENMAREAETMSINNIDAASRIQELRGKLDQSQMAYKEL